MNIFQNLIDFIFPKICIVSGNKLSNNNSNIFIEDNILSNLELADKDRLSELQKFTNSDYIFSLYNYKDNTTIKKIVHNFKYYNNTKLAFFCGTIIGNRLITEQKNNIDKFEYLIPVPLHRTKLRERGYNQSELLTKGIISITNHKILKNKIFRVKNTKSQTGLNISERLRNIENAFAIKWQSTEKCSNIIIIDDVITTGATIREVIKTIRKTARIKIGVITFALAND